MFARPRDRPDDRRKEVADCVMWLPRGMRIDVMLWPTNAAPPLQFRPRQAPQGTVKRQMVTNPRWNRLPPGTLLAASYRQAGRSGAAETALMRRGECSCAPFPV